MNLVRTSLASALLASATLLAGCGSSDLMEVRDGPQLVSPYGDGKPAPMPVTASNPVASSNNPGVAPVGAAAISTSQPIGTDRVALQPVVAEPATGLSPEGEIFRSVCLANAPAFEGYTVESAARRALNAATSIRGMGLEYASGRSCKINFTGAGMPSDAEIASLATSFAARNGGSVRARRSAIGGAKWYEVKIGRAKYGIEGSARRGVAFLMIAER